MADHASHGHGVHPLIPVETSDPDVYTAGIYSAEHAMKTARIFKHGNSQAVRLPKEFRFHDDEVLIKR